MEMGDEDAETERGALVAPVAVLWRCYCCCCACVCGCATAKVDADAVGVMLSGTVSKRV